MDRTAKLPDEILMEIFDRLPSLGGKLRVESVSRRFQRCLLDLLSTKPIPLVFDSEKMRLNGYQVSRDELPGVVRTLASKAKFKRVELNHSPRKLLNKILAALVCPKSNCLDKVTAFQVLSRTGARGGLLTEVLAKCTKLSIVRIDWSSADLEKLASALGGMSLTGLSISVRGQDQQQLIQLYRSIKPSVLKIVKLDLFRMALDADLLFNQLCSNAWAAVEEIDFDWKIMDFDIAALFSSLTHLPALRKCDIQLECVERVGPLVPALLPLFANKTEITASFRCFGIVAGCRFVGLIRDVQVVHPDLQVGFGVTGCKPTLTVGKVTYTQDVEWLRSCNDITCAECAIFYPILIESLIKSASQLQDAQLANRRLDRCRVDSVVGHLNQEMGLPFYAAEKRSKALRAEMHQAGNQATITFESLVHQEQFHITVGCGPCLGNGCPVCI